MIKECLLPEEIDEVTNLITAEDLDHGGLLRPVSIKMLENLINSGGGIWGNYDDKNKLLCCFTTEVLQGACDKWIYFNYGVVRKDYRYLGGGQMEETLRYALNILGSDYKYIVIYIGRSIFTRLGFSEVNIHELNLIDPQIGSIIELKLRPEKKAQIFIS